MDLDQQVVKIMFEIDQKWSSSKSIFQKSSVNQQGDYQVSSLKNENPQTILIHILCPFATKTKVKNIFKNLVI